MNKLLRCLGLAAVFLGLWSPVSANAAPIPKATPSAAPTVHYVPAPRTASSAIDVTTLPANATLWLDGSFIGPTPLFLDALPPGHHTITLTKSGWKTQEFAVELSPGAIIVTGRRLHEITPLKDVRHPGSVLIHGTPDAGSLHIDSAAVTTLLDQPLTLPAGRHIVSVSIGGRAQTRAFTVFSDTVTTLVLDASGATVDAHADLVAPVDESLPDGSYTLVGDKIIIHTGTHHGSGRLNDALFVLDGKRLTLSPAPVLVGRRLYLPVTILDQMRR